MSDEPQSPFERLKSFPLWAWGVMLILAGIFAYAVMGFLFKPGTSAAAQGQAAGRVVAVLLAVIAGVVLIIIHFVRRMRQ